MLLFIISISLQVKFTYLLLAGMLVVHVASKVKP